MRKKAELKKIIHERIRILLDLARAEVKKNPARSKRYVQLVKRLVKKYKVRLQRKEKVRFCKKCNNYWIPGYNVQVKHAKARKLIIYRGECGAVRKIPYKNI